MKAGDKHDEQRFTTGSFECAVNLTDRRTLRITGYTYSDDSLADIHARVDAAQDIMDRQVVRCDIQNKEAQIKQHENNLEHIVESFNGLVNLTKQGKKLTSVQKQSVDNYDMTVAQAKKAIESLRAAIKEGKQKINGAAHA